jgi:DNA-binding GntR family transcriptional regulator
MPPKKELKKAKKGDTNDFVYRSLKELILSGRLRPGNRLVHQELGDRLEVSRTPVREALERLYQEGYAGRRPRRGYYVAEFDATSIRDLYGTREALEIFAYDSTCAAGFREDDISELAALLNQYAALFPGTVSRARLELDKQFHLKLASFCRNAELGRTLESVFEKISLKRRLDGQGLVSGNDPLKDHTTLLAAITEGRYQGGRDILQRHIREACDRLLHHLEQDSGYSVELAG